MQSGYAPVSLPLLVLIISCIVTTFSSSTSAGEASPRCRDNERRALLDIRQGLTDPTGRLSSWAGDGDCCAWSGVGCSNRTGHVVRLDLRNPFVDYGRLGGNVSSSLLQLKHLSYLDLSKNDFEGMEIPEFLGSLPRLRHLRLAEARFGGMLPPHLGNLTDLWHLDLNGNGRPYRRPYALSLHWLSNLSSLRYLDMSSVNLSEAADWLHSVNRLPSLKVLNLDGTYPRVLPAYLPHVNLSSLVTLGLSLNDLGPQMPDWLYNISSLERVNLGYNQLEGPISPALGNLSSLNVLQLQNNDIQGPLPWTFRYLCNLRTLDLSYNKVAGDISEMMEGLPRCSRYSMETLNFGRNQLTGHLPNGLGQFKMLRTLNVGDNLVSGSIPSSIGGLSDLRELYLGSNRLNGSVPESLGQLSNLVVLDLGFNSLTGVISDAHFANVTRLEAIFLSSNSLVFGLSSNFAPRFQLTNIHLASCQLGMHFPAWLQTQHRFSTLDISNAGISDTVPDWFWNNLSPRAYYLNISHNQIIGNLSMLAKFPSVQIVDLSYNIFQGPLPPLHPEVRYLYLSHNSFSGSLFNLMSTSRINFNIWAISLSSNQLSGSIPASICEMTMLEVLDLSENGLAGEIPTCWRNFTMLGFLNLARNTLHGTVPDSLGSLQSLQSLHLNGNNLRGEIPPSLGQCRQLVTLDLGENMLTGKIPAWIGELLSSLRLLRLRSNKLHGPIPTELAKLSYLQVLDLAHNNLSGSVPRSFGNLSAMVSGEKSSVQPFAFVASGDRVGYAYIDLRAIYVDTAVIAMKGRESEYDKILFLVISLDLSSNSLSGHIPEELAKLVGLRSLNLSGNQLTGEIPEEIGNMRKLETLDLSENKLSGAIPPGISSLNSLSHLNLSNNGLSGRIPSGNQLQTLTNSSIYEGNPDLCGFPLQRVCPGDEASGVPPQQKGDPDDHGASGAPEEANSDHQGVIDMPLLYFSMGLGFAAGFWVFLGSLLLKKSWRVSYFEFIDTAAHKLGCVFSTRR